MAPNSLTRFCIDLDWAFSSSEALALSSALAATCWITPIHFRYGTIDLINPLGLLRGGRINLSHKALDLAYTGTNLGESLPGFLH